MGVLLGYSNIIDSLVNEDMLGVNRKNKATDAETLVEGILTGKLSKVKKTCVDDKDLKMLFNKSKLGKSNKNKLIAKYDNNVSGEGRYSCLVQIYSIGKGEYITFTFIFDGYIDLVCDELEGTEEILLECYGGELSFEVYI